MDKWDQEKLEQVVSEKLKTQKTCQSNKICKFFLKAIVDKKYGWFWDCPNGSTCPYKHALPEGFKLRSMLLDAKKDDSLDPIEDILEMERRKLPPGGTKVTEQTFRQWKQRKLKEKEEAAKKAAEDRELEITSGKAKMSGKEMFSYRPDLFVRIDEEDDEVIDLKQFQTKEEVKEENGPPTESEAVPDPAELYVEDETLFREEDIPEDMSEDEPITTE